MLTDHARAQAHPRIFRPLLLVALALPFVALAQYAPAPEPPTGENDVRAKLRPYAQVLADLQDRPRRVIYTEYPVSARRGLVRGFVHVGDGTVVLARTDLVVDASLPIVIRRAYHSARTQSRDFGATGWHLTAAERIERRPGNRYTYTYGNGATLDLDAQGQIESGLQAYLTDVLEARVRGANQIDVLTRTGLRKRFSRRADAYALTSAEDSHGNRIAFHYTSAGALTRIDSSSGAWVTFERDERSRVTRIEDSHGRAVSYAYDEGAGRLVSVIDSGGQQWSYDYDSAHRLTSTSTPNGIVDMEFRYDARGRALMSRANGSRLEFTHARAATTVKDSRGLTTTYVSGAGGLTTEVTNALGTRTALRLSRSGVPMALMRNGRQVVQFEDEGSSRNRKTRSHVTAADGHNYVVDYDARHRVIRIRSAAARAGFEAQEYGDALVPSVVTHADGSNEAVDFDASGELTRLTGRDGRTLSFRREGNRWLVEDNSRHRGELHLDAAGRITAATLGDGQTLSFQYNDIGLRERTDASAGWNIRYQYDASGSLFHSSNGPGDEIATTYDYVSRADRRLDEIANSKDSGLQFLYDPLGRVAEMRSADESKARFEYDDTSRLTRVERPNPDMSGGTGTLEYAYVPGEPDIAAQLSRRALPVFNQQKEVTDFASRFDIILTRIKPAVQGLVTYDELRDELTLAVDPVRWNPMAPVARSIAALRLDGLLAADTVGINAFLMPSNRLFIPPEYWSVNCCVCSCDPSDPNCPPHSDCEGCQPPPPSCDVAFTDESAVGVVLGWAVEEPWERAVTMFCVGTNFMTFGYYSDSFGQFYSGTTVTNDPCATAITLAENWVGAAHSHPFFENLAEYRAGLGCRRDQSFLTPGQLREVNDVNEDFSPGDRTAFSGLGKPLYLRVPTGDRVKKLLGTTTRTVFP